MSSDAAKPPLVRRYAVAAVGIGALIAIGFVGKLRIESYQLLGTLGVWLTKRHLDKQPLRTAWVEAEAPARLGRRADWVFMLATVFGGLAAVQALVRGDVVGVLWGGMLIGGAWGLGYALSCADARTVRFAIGAAVAGLVFGAVVYAPDLAEAARTGGVPRMIGRAVFSAITYLPASFGVEEVVFRGVLFARLRGGSTASNVVAALFTSALWGVWHVPMLASRAPGELAILVAWHAGVGAALCWLWARTRNLLPCACAHALLDAVRDAARGW